MRFGKGNKHTEVAKEKVRQSLLGKFGEDSRNWKGEKAGYAAIHIWINKHFTKKNYCEICGKSNKEVSRLEFGNVDGNYKRIPENWITVCPSCHRKMDYRKSKIYCPQGHKYTPQNTYINSRGHRECKTCMRESRRRWENAKANKI